MPDPDRQQRFRELLDGNRARWAGIARAYAPPSDRDDLLQEITLQVWRSLERFEGTASLDTWAYRVALNTALAWRRKSGARRDRLTRTDRDIAELPSANADGSEQRVVAVLDAFLAALNEADRAVMLLHLDGVSQAEAAEVLGVAPGAYRTRLHRVRRRFEADFCHPEDEP